MLRKKFNRQLENNTIINHVVDEIPLKEIKKWITASELQEVLDSDCDENNLYEIGEMSFEETKEKIE